MPSVSNGRNQNVTLPSMESLEERLLLTTLHGGDFFVYHNSKGDDVRVTFTGDLTDTVELMAYDAGVVSPTGQLGDVIDVPGLMGGNLEVPWPLDSSYAGQSVNNVDTPGTWQEEDISRGLRGARVEIYSVYFSQVSANSILTFATIGPGRGGDGWPTVLAPWTKEAPNVAPNGDGYFTAPADSGGVIIGSFQDASNPIRYLAVGTTFPDQERYFYPNGAFPGGLLRPGITVAQDGFAVRVGDLGANVQSIGLDSAGQIYAVDSSTLHGTPLDKHNPISLGRDIRALAGKSGTFVGIDSNAAPFLGPVMGTNVQSLAVNAGMFYAVDGTTRMLYAGPARGGAGAIGELRDISSNTWSYTNVRGMDFDSAGNLFAIADLMDPNTSTGPALPAVKGPYLIRISTAPNAIGQVDVLRYNPAVDGGAGFDDLSSIAFSPTDVLYGLDSGSNRLVTINMNTQVATAGSTLTANGSPIAGVTGIEFIGDQLYAVTNSALYAVDVTNGQCTLVQNVTLSDMSALAYDDRAALGGAGYLYTVTAQDYSGANTGISRVAGIALGAVMNTTDVFGVVTQGYVLFDGTDEHIVYQNVTAMDYDSTGKLYAIAEQATFNPYTSDPNTKYLILIDDLAGTATVVATLGNAATLSGLTFDSADNLFGVDPTTNTLYQIDLATGAASNGVALDVTGITDLQFVTIGANDVLYGVTSSTLYKIDTATGHGISVNDVGRTNLGRTDLGSLAYCPDPDQTNVLWTASVEDGGFRLIRVDMASTLVTHDGLNISTRGLRVIDANEPAYAYSNIRGMDFDSADVMYAIGTIVNLNPGAVADPASFGPYLLTIDPVTGLATQVALLDLANLSSIAFGPADLLYGVDGNTNTLVTIDLATGVSSARGPLQVGGVTLTGVAGIDFINGTLYAASSDTLYTVNTVTGALTLSAKQTVTGMASLSGDPTNPTLLWSAVPFDGQYQLIRMLTDPQGGTQDVGRIIVGGTVAGTVTIGGSVDVIEMGFLWGNVAIGKNLDSFILREGGGAIPVPGGFAVPLKTTQDPVTLVQSTASSSLIHVRGALTFLNSMGTTLYSAVQVDAEPSIAWQNVGPVQMDPSNPTYRLNELEYLEPDPYSAGWSLYWSAGELLDYTNDTPATAQFVSHPNGTYEIAGELQTTLGDSVDFYAIPLMAGQIITVTCSGSAVVRLLDQHGIYKDAYGYETPEDWGIGPGMGLSLKPMTFTAQEAGIYYLQVNGGGTYIVSLVDGPTAALGAISVGGDAYSALFVGEGKANLNNVAVLNAGGLGAVYVVGNTYFSNINVVGGADFVAFVAGTIGALIGDAITLGDVTCDGNIGNIASTAEFIGLNITAGASSGFYNYDAYIQNISAASDYAAGTILATGDIGLIETIGSMGASLISVNSDAIGPAGKIDQMDIGGDWGATTLRHGPKGDIGYIYVGGVIMVTDGVWTHPVTETTVSDGRSSLLNDDSGGRMTVTPMQTPVLDANGRPTFDPITRQPIMTPMPTYSYSYIPVDDVAGGVGGVIANLRINGTAVLNGSGTTQLGHLDLSGVLAGSTMTINGTGNVGVYYVDATGLASFTNTTPGNLISALFTGDVTAITLAGSIGPENGSAGPKDKDGKEQGLGERLRGRNMGSAGGVDAPGFGWHHGTFNGVEVTGDLTTLTINGALGDLRVGGTAGTIRVNADNHTPAFREYGARGWDGVRGVVYVGTRIEQFYVGDGLADDGGSHGMANDTSDSYPQAIITSGGSIGTISINGPRRVSNGLVFGELNGAIIATADIVTTTTDPQGNVTTVQTPAIERIIGTNGASETAVISVGQMDTWQNYKGSPYVYTSGIGLIDFSGQGAVIHGSHIAALYVQKVSTSVDSNGIDHSRIMGSNPLPNQLVIGQVLGGGPGLFAVTVSATGGNIGVVKGVGPEADIIDSTVVTNDGVNEITARDLINNGFHAPGTVKLINAKRDMRDNIVGSQQTLIGAVDRVNVGRNFARNQFTVAGTIGSMVVKGDFDNSVLTLQGPATGYLKSLVVTGDISGQIVSGGRIGSITSLKGAISADISTLKNNTNADVALIQTAKGFTGELEVAGSLRRFISAVSLGSNPDDNDGLTQKFNIWGNLDFLRVGSKGIANLYTDISVGGNIGTIDVDGTLYSRITVNGDMGKLLLDGALGGTLDSGPRGSVKVYGNLGQLRFSATSDLVADLDIGGSIQAISLKGGDVVGSIISRHGQVMGVSVVGGDIDGTITGNSIGAISVVGGNIKKNITADNGNIKSITLKADKTGGGNLQADVTVPDGRIDVLSLVGGSAEAGHTVYASGGIGSVSITGGDLNADLLSGMDIGSLTIKGSDLTGKVSADGLIGAVSVDGTISGVLRAGTGLTSLKAGDLTNALVSSGWNIGTIAVKNSVVNSRVMAGFDVGADGAIGGFDDNALNNAMVHSGNIASMTIGGALDRSVVTAGIDDALTPLDTSDDAEADGVSSIVKLQVKGGFGADATQTAVLADTSVDPTFVGGGAVVNAGVTRTEAGVGTQFGDSIGQKMLITAPGLVLTLTGDGVAWFNEGNPGDNAKLVLKGTSIRSALTIQYTGAGNYKTIDIVSDDDSALASMKVGGNVQIGDVSVDGMVNALEVALIAGTPTWKLPGGVGTAKVGQMNATVTAGAVKSWTMSGALAGGSMTADSIGAFTTSSNLVGDLTSTMGGATAVTVGADLRGDLTSRGTIKTLTVGGSIADGAKVNVTHGDLTTMKVTTDVVGAIGVDRGAVGSVTVTTGDFGGSDATAFRANTGIGNFTVSKGDFSGLMSTDGDLKSLSVPKGALTGRVRSGGTIKSMSVGSMDGAVVTAAHEFLSGKIAGDMNASVILAGFDPGDGGFDGTNGGEAVNVRVDAFSDPDGLGLVPVEDTPLGGNVGTVTIGGYMITSTISAGVAPGVDGYVGTDDDMVAGTGYVTGKVAVKHGIEGTQDDAQAFGVYAVSGMPKVTEYGQPFEENDNAYVRSMVGTAGMFVVTEVLIPFRSIEVTFNHLVNFSTINTALMDPTRPTTFSLIVSADTTFGNGDDVNVSDTVPNVVTYDRDTHTVTLTLVGKTWETLGAGTNFRLVIDGNIDDNGIAVQDIRGNVLDGEYTGSLPTGDGLVGGDFVYQNAYGQVVLSSVPVYLWRHGCAPTAAGMIVGYYDGMAAYQDLIPGDATTQTPEVNQAIASQGNETDYALYNGYNDTTSVSPYPDMSEINPAGVHVDDSLADFMKTSRSAEGLTYGGTWADNMGPGIEAYFAMQGYAATTEYLPWGEFTWADLIQEINSGRPVMLGVDSDGDGRADHAITAVGYDMTTHRYAAFTTWTTTGPAEWFDFQGVSVGHLFGVSAGVTVNVA